MEKTGEVSRGVGVGQGVVQREKEKSENESWHFDYVSSIMFMLYNVIAPSH